MILVTGGAGFIGSNFVLDWLAQGGETVINLDKLTYCGNLNNLCALRHDCRHIFVKGDICHSDHVAALLAEYQPRAIVHFAAESHVDRSIYGPSEFIATNVNGTFSLLQAAYAYWQGLTNDAKANFRFLHISTDEVYGSLGPNDPPFTECSPYTPNSPYAASKAAADHLVRAYHHTYGLPTLITNCSNNYGPLQFPEKFIPLIITNACANKALPIYGDGKNVRDWLYVSDHCAAIRAVLAHGQVGQTYNIGGANEKTNLEVVHAICDLLDRWAPKKTGSYRDQIQYVADRPGHDRRYAIDMSKLKQSLGWEPLEKFETGLAKTVRWYLDRADWVADVQSGEYLKWLEKNYEKRVG